MTSRWLGLVLAAGLVRCGGTTEDGASGGGSGSGGSATGGSGGGPDFFACQVSSECLLRPASCCGSCGAATRSDVIALNQNPLVTQGEALVHIAG